MKYIRTKDGRIGIWDKTGSIFFSSNSSCVYGYFNDYTDKHLQILCNILKNDFHTEILTQADTIEELCDEFVMISEYRKPYVVRKGGYKGVFEGWQFCKEEKHKTTFYGAIWTDKGLIYVAKMNLNGELELL